jgi:type II secretory pathway component GspD/PulD (secretin)
VSPVVTANPDELTLIIKHVSPAQVADGLRQQFGGTHTVTQNGQRIRVAGPRGQFDDVRRLVASHDLPAAGRAKPGYVTDIFPLRHAGAAEAGSKLKNSLPGRADILIDEENNTLVVSAAEAELSAARQMITSLDVPAAGGPAPGR